MLIIIKTTLLMILNWRNWYQISFSNLSNINQINWDDLNLFLKNKDIEITQIKEPGFLINEMWYR